MLGSYCQVRRAARIETIVFNRDFVERNFNQPTELKGVFTLGEKNIDILNKIAAAKSEVDESGEKIAKLTVTLNGGDGSGGQQGELAKLEANLKKACWSQKQKHDETFSGAFEGFRNNAERFKGKILQERKSNSATLRTLARMDHQFENWVVFGYERRFVVSSESESRRGEEIGRFLVREVNTFGATTA